jgi:hypothetical protein
LFANQREIDDEQSAFVNQNKMSTLWSQTATKLEFHWIASTETTSVFKGQWVWHNMLTNLWQDNKTSSMIKLCNSESAIFVQIVFWKQSSSKELIWTTEKLHQWHQKNEFSQMLEQIYLYSILHDFFAQGLQHSTVEHIKT